MTSKRLKIKKKLLLAYEQLSDLKTEFDGSEFVCFGEPNEAAGQCGGIFWCVQGQFPWVIRKSDSLSGPL